MLESVLKNVCLVIIYLLTNDLSFEKEKQRTKNLYIYVVEVNSMTRHSVLSCHLNPGYAQN